MACNRCKRRSALISRTFRKLISPKNNGPASSITVKNTDCKIVKSLTPEGYVVKCLNCPAKSKPSPIPETESLECQKGKN